MSVAQVFLSTSLKGGVGKSTVAANLAYRLAVAGHRTLLCDLDFDVRSLDLIMGYESKQLFDICDVLTGRCKFSMARLIDPRTPELNYLGAPYNFCDDLSEDDIISGMKKLFAENPYDYVILDTPGAETAMLGIALKLADEALVVATHNPTALRGAQRSAELAEAAGVKARLIINNFDSTSVIRDRRTGMLDIIDTAGVQLLGVVPYDRELFLAQEHGKLADDSFISGRAFANIAQRIAAESTGERPVPILMGVRSIKRKRVIAK